MLLPNCVIPPGVTGTATAAVEEMEAFDRLPSQLRAILRDTIYELAAPTILQVYLRSGLVPTLQAIMIVNGRLREAASAAA